MSDSLDRHSLAELGRLLRARELSPVELLEHVLNRIDRCDPDLEAFRALRPEEALAEARRTEALLHEDTSAGSLVGIPYAAKDLFDVAGLATTAGFSGMADNVAEEDAAVVRRLRGAGMVLVGKTNTVQFAYGGAGVNLDHGTPRNPWKQEHHLPGGSSSGSAVAVAAGLVPMALGTDTGGSVRIPSSLCGVTGLKTTVGRVSREGVYPLSSSLDSVGPLCRSVEDVALVYDAIHGPDPADDSTRGQSRHDVLTGLGSGVAGMRIAVAESVFWEDADDEVAAAVRSAAQVFETLGASVESIEFPQAAEARALNPKGLVIAAEAYTVNRHWVEQHYDELDPVVAPRLAAGREVIAADYLQALEAWAALRVETEQAMSGWDALLCPTTPIPAVPLAEVDASSAEYSRVNLLYLRNTAIGNILGLCGLSVPCGMTQAGLPIGLMIYGRPFQEDRTLRIGHAFQQGTDFHKAFPPLG